jgi:hypothetical protein
MHGAKVQDVAKFREKFFLLFLYGFEDENVRIRTDVLTLLYVSRCLCCKAMWQLQPEVNDKLQW